MKNENSKKIIANYLIDQKMEAFIYFLKIKRFKENNDNNNAGMTFVVKLFVAQRCFMNFFLLDPDVKAFMIIQYYNASEIWKQIVHQNQIFDFSLSMGERCEIKKNFFYYNTSFP